VKEWIISIILIASLLIAFVALILNEWYFDKMRKQARAEFIESINKIVCEYMIESRRKSS